MKKVLGFRILKYDRIYLETLTDIQKNELYLKDCDNTICYDCVDDFFNELNDGNVNIDIYWLFIVDVD